MGAGRSMVLQKYSYFEIRDVLQVSVGFINKYKQKNTKKRLSNIARLVFDIISTNLTRSDYRQESTLENEYKHWFRAKFFSSIIAYFFNIILRAKLLFCLG